MDIAKESMVEIGMGKNLPPLLEEEESLSSTVYPDQGFVSRFLSGVPVDLANSFSERQLFAIQQAFGPWDGQERRKKPFRSIRIPLARYILALRLERK